MSGNLVQSLKLSHFKIQLTSIKYNYNYLILPKILLLLTNSNKYTLCTIFLQIPQKYKYILNYVVRYCT